MNDIDKGNSVDIVETQDEDIISRSRIILRKICKRKGFTVASALTQICTQSKDMISERTCNELVGASTLSLKEDELFDDEHPSVHYSRHCEIVKELAVTVETFMSDIIKVVAVYSFHYVQDKSA